MNYQKIMETINSIYKEIENKEDKLCIFINGEWGIGKTHTIRHWFNDNNERFDLKYISVFGKQSVREIENELIMKVLSSSSYETTKKKLKEGWFGKGNKIIKSQVGLNVFRDIVSKKIGIKLEASEYVKNISIENLVNTTDKDKKVIICIDDIERISSKIDLKDILGLIERTAENFNIIIIANSSKIEEKELKIFEEYKEKIIDYEFEINELDDSLLKDILQQMLDNISDDDINLIIKTYNIPLEIDEVNSKEKRIIKLKNIRIYKKYIYLISRVKKEVNNILHTSEFHLEDEFIDGCKAIIGLYYFDKYLDYKLASDNIKKTTLSFREFNLYKILYKIFMHEDYDTQALNGLLTTDTEISKDIKQLYHLYRMDRESANVLLEKIETKINVKDTAYFFDQEQVITLFDALTEIDYPKNFKDELFEEAKKYYKPVITINPPYFDSDTWSDVNYSGEVHCSVNTRQFINKVNSYNKQEYYKFRKQEFQKSFDTGNVDVLIQVVSGIKKQIDIEAFEKVFEFAITKIELEDRDKDKYWKLIYKVMEKTPFDIAKKYLKDKISVENDYFSKRRLTHLVERLNEEEYYRKMEDAERESEQE